MRTFTKLGGNSLPVKHGVGYNMSAMFYNSETVVAKW